MLLRLQQFVNFLNKPKYYLLLANIFLVLFLIIFNNLGVVPMGLGDFTFFAFLMLAFALYRPGWAFLFFIGTIMLENINLAPESLGIAVRPYQFIGALIILAIIIRLVMGKLSFKIIKLKWYDWLIVGINIFGFFSLINAPDRFASLKLVLILASFSMLYFLTRNYIQTAEDLKKVVPFFLSSSTIVVLYGIWQNIAFLYGANSFEIMPGRPNATFAEADWLGMYLVLLISVIYGILYAKKNASAETDINPDISKCPLLITNYALFFLLSSCFVLLIITVSRSAWLGALASLFLFLFIFFTDLRFRNWKWKETFGLKIKILAALVVAIAAVYVFHLTNFQLFNRVQSTRSGQQKITVSCQDKIDLPQNINTIGELEKYGCRHINLEDIAAEKEAGNHIAEVYRSDPNVSIRSEIYKKSWQKIKNYPLFGIGWGSIGHILGQDERGAMLNSSNIFLQIWLGSGGVGLMCFVVLIIYILGKTIAGYLLAQNIGEKAVAIFIISAWFGLIVFNMFNAGMFLGLLWVWLAISQISAKGRSVSG